jgi:hypothetical protein
VYLYFWLIIIVNPLGIDPVHCRSRLSCMHEPRYQCKLMSWVLTHYVTVTTTLSIVVVQSDLTQSDCQLVNVICSSLFQEKTNKEEVDLLSTVALFVCLLTKHFAIAHGFSWLPNKMHFTFCQPHSFGGKDHFDNLALGLSLHQCMLQS